MDAVPGQPPTTSHQPLLSIGELAERSGVSRRTVRYYVQRGLIDPPEGRGRGSGYTEQHVAQIQRVLRLQREGLPLDQIGELPEGAEPPPARVPLPSALVLRVPLIEGARLELDAGTALPDPAALEELAEACRRILRRGDVAHSAGLRPEPATTNHEPKTTNQNKES